MQDRNLIDFTGQVALVTGGTKGIGAGIARSFLEVGAEVVICGRSQPEKLPEVHGRKAHFVAADVRDSTSLDALFAEIESRYGRLDVAVNNAGGSPAVDAATVSPRFSESIIRLNLLAPLNVAQKANALMQKQEGGGVVLFIGSVSAHRPSPGTAAYGAAKAGILSLVKSLAVEFAPKVRVVSVSPGLIHTEQSQLHYGDEAGIRAVSQTIPAERMGDPEDIGRACLWAASPMASYLSGTDVLLHGGGEKPAFLNASNADANG